jgi:hypothetical protein
MLRIITILLGIGFVFAGVAGFLPMFMMDGLLFGFFEVDSMHNIVHLVSGVIAIMAATSYHYTVLFLKVFGVIYTIVAIWGFWTGGDLYMMHVNMADNILHIVIGVVALFLGFSARKTQG